MTAAGTSDDDLDLLSVQSNDGQATSAQRREAQLLFLRHPTRGDGPADGLQ